MNRTILRASPGMVLTDGEIYGKVILPANGMDVSAFHEITQAEYEAVMAQRELESRDEAL